MDNIITEQQKRRTNNRTDEQGTVELEKAEVKSDEPDGRNRTD
jgi:hypothetical protein